jgi:monoamine oxidase
MSGLGHATPSPYTRPIKLEGDPKGTNVIVLGAGCAGLSAALELRNAGYRVQLLEYSGRPGGRSWTIRGGDSIIEMGGETQMCEFSPGNYINPGPWRIAHHHHAMLDYCRRLKVPLEPFIEVNYNAYLHSTQAFGGKPMRQHEVLPDFQGYVADLLAKASRQDHLDDALGPEDIELLRETLQGWAGLNRDLRYVKGPESSRLRGNAALDWAAGAATPGEPLGLTELLRLLRDSELFHTSNHSGYRDLQTPLFQPMGGMDMLPRAFARELAGVIQFNAKVTAIQQDGRGVTVAYEDMNARGSQRTAQADYCLCTIPLSVLSRLDVQVGEKMKTAIGSVPYSSYMKIGLEFKRRFWEQDEAIFGGFTHTNLPISTISYPSYGVNTEGPGVLYGAVLGVNSFSYEYAGMPAKERIQKALEYGAQIHPQYSLEFRNGVAVCWHRVPFAMGGFAMWSEAAHKEHYQSLRAIDGRFMLAGEALATAVGGWQEGAILSALDVIERLHQRVIST